MSDTTTGNSAVDDLAVYVAEVNDPAWLAPVRRRALERFQQTDWPAISQEEWRRTSLRGFEFSDYALPGAPTETDAGVRATVASADGESAHGESPVGLLRFVDGSPADWWLSDAAVRAGVELVPWQTIADEDERGARLATLLAQAVERADDRIQLWRYAAMNHGVLLDVPPNVTLAGPVVIEHHGQGDQQLAAGQTVVLLGDGAAATVVRRLTSDSDGELLLLDGTIGRVGANGRLTVQTVEMLGQESVLFSNAALVADADAAITLHQSHLGADFVKSRSECDLSGAGSAANLFGIYFGTNEQHIDLRTVQRHHGRHSESWAYFRGAVRDEAHAIYQGLIQVDRTAKGTDAYLTNKHLILSDTARADSIPSLNIQTDDVKCSHGSSTGKLDPNQLFYLLSRGYSESEARRALVEGFFEDVITKGHPLTHDELRTRVYERVPG